MPLFIKIRIKIYLILLFIFSITIISNVNVYAERFFQPHSTWYEPIPDKPALFEDSDKIIKDFSLYGGNVHIHTAMPVFDADAEATANPTTVRIENNKFDGAQKAYIEAQGWNIVPIPKEAKPREMDVWCDNPTYYNDGHMLILSQDGATYWDLYQARKCDSSCARCSGGWKATVVRKYINSENGVDGAHGPLKYTSQGMLQYDNHGAVRLGYNPAMHGLLTYDEVYNDTIDHALSFITCCDRNDGIGKWGYHPAMGYGAGKGAADSSRTYAPIHGMRYQLDPNFDVDAYIISKGLSVYSKRVLIALQKYGMIFVDAWGSGFSSKNGTGIIAENLTYNSSRSHGGNEGWGDLFSPNKVFSDIPKSAFRVIKPLIPSRTPTQQPIDLIDNKESTAPSDNDEENVFTNNSVISIKTSRPITIDGNLSEFIWDDVKHVSFVNPSKSDNNVKVYTLWDDDNLYFAYNVTDLHKEADNEKIYSGDGVEIFIDTKNDKTTSMNDNDYHFIANINNLSSNETIDVKSITTSNGYTTEIAIPWSTINVIPSAGMSMGLLLGINDRDNSNSSQFDWMDLIKSGDYARPNLWGNITISDEVDLIPPAPPTALIIN